MKYKYIFINYKIKIFFLINYLNYLDLKIKNKFFLMGSCCSDTKIDGVQIGNIPSH